jgi:hypothetical protein
MTAESAPQEPGRAPEEPRRRRPRIGCLAWSALGVLAVTGIVVAIGFAFDQGPDASQPPKGYDAGRADAYAPADVTHIDAEHLFIVRLEDGSFVALYDKSPRRQELKDENDCRVHWEDVAPLGSVAQLPGFTGAFVEDCDAQARTVWLADGTYAFGAGYGDLDRYGTRVTEAGELIIDTSSRSCTRSVGTIGIPPFEVRRCGRGE